MKKKVLTILTISIFVLAFHAYGDGDLIVDGITKVGGKIQAKDSGGIELATDEGTTRLYINDAGKIAIGTTSPSWPFHIKQAGPSNQTNIVGCFEDTTAERICFGVGKMLTMGPSMEAIFLGYDRDAEHGFLGFPINNGVSQNLVIKYDGKIGIDTTNPTSKLQVVGLPTYADNTEATNAGLTVGAFYRDGDFLKVVH